MSNTHNPEKAAASQNLGNNIHETVAEEAARTNRPEGEILFERSQGRPWNPPEATPSAKTAECKLRKGDSYNALQQQRLSASLIGWSDGSPRAKADYFVSDYFGPDGSYLGPDDDGIEPIFSEVPPTVRHVVYASAGGRDYSALMLNGVAEIDILESGEWHAATSGTWDGDASGQDPTSGLTDAAGLPEEANEAISAALRDALRAGPTPRPAPVEGTLWVDGLSVCKVEVAQTPKPGLWLIGGHPHVEVYLEDGWLQSHTGPWAIALPGATPKS